MLIQKPQELTTGPNTVAPFYPKHPSSSDSAAISLVESIVRENSTLKDQISHIEAELDKSRHLSDKLLNENQTLRQLYTGRTADIAKLLKSILIQTDQEKVDYQHQSHLIRELNFATLREIKSLDQQGRQAEQRLEEKKKGIYALIEQKNVLQNQELNTLKARIQNGISPQVTQKAKKYYEEKCQRNRILEQEVDHLLILNTKVRGELRGLSKSGQMKRDQILVERYECEQALANLKQENKRYQSELTVDKIELEKAEEDRNHKEERYNSVLKAMNQEVKKYENNQRVFSEINSEREKCKAGILVSAEAQATLNSKLDSIRQEKEDIQNSIKNLKRKIANSKEEWIQREEAFRQDHRQNLIKITNQIAKQQSGFEEEKAKITAERERVENQTNLLKNELESLQERIAQYSRLIKERPNPIVELEKIELGLRLKRR